MIVIQFSCSVVSDSLRPHGLHTAHQASLSITNSQSLLRLMSIESVMPCDHLILCHFLLLLPSTFPSTRIFSKSVLHIRWSNIRVSASAPILPMNIQDWFPFRLTGLISLSSKGLKSLLQHHNSKVQKNFQKNSSALSFLYSPALSSIHDYWKNHSIDYVDLW